MTESPEGDVERLSFDVAAATGSPILIEKGDLDLLIKAYADARNAREEADERAKALRAAEGAVEVQLFDAMERLSLRSVQHERGRFGLNDLAWADIEDSDVAREWAKAAMPELLTLNNQRLSMIVREFLKGERDELPPGVGFKTSRKISWRRT